MDLFIKVALIEIHAYDTSSVLCLAGLASVRWKKILETWVYVELFAIIGLVASVIVLTENQGND